MPYGTIKVDTITFTDAGVDKSVAISGLVQNPTYTGNVTVTGTVSGNIIQGGTTVSGLTVTGTTANFASGVFTTQVSGAIYKAPAGTAGAPSVQIGTGASVAPGLYSTATDQLAISTGGASRIIVDSVGQLRIIDTGSAGAPAFITGNDLTTGLFSGGTGILALSTSGNERLRIDASGRMLTGTSLSKQIPAWPGNYTLQYEASKQQAGITVAQTASALLNWGSTSNAGSTLTFGKSRSNAVGTYGVTALVDGSNLGNLIFSGDDSTKFVAGAAISAYVDGTPGADNMPSRLVFSTTASGSASSTERMRITSSGLVGIGTTAPSAKLDIAASGDGTEVLRLSTERAWAFLQANTGATSELWLKDLTGTKNFRIVSSIDDTVFRAIGNNADSANSRIYLHEATTGRVAIGNTNPGGTLHVTAGSGIVPFIAAGSASEYARIDSSGRLLVGTSSATEAGGFLTISTETDFAPIFLSNHGDGIDRCTYIFASRARTSKASPSLVSDGDRLFGLIGRGYDGTAFRSSAGIRMDVDGTAAASAMPGRITFSTTASGTTNLTEHLRITSGGTVVYNQPAPAAVDVTTTLTVANLIAKIITSSTAAAVTMTLPLGTSMDTGFAGLYTNMAFEWSVINTGATNAVTVNGNTGHTIVGSATVSASNSGRFLSRRTAANTWVTYRLSS